MTSTQLINQWRQQGQPEIELSPGVVIVDLERYLQPCYRLEGRVCVFGERGHAELEVIAEKLGNVVEVEQPSLFGGNDANSL